MIQAIEGLFTSYEQMREYLLANDELSFASEIEAITPKVLLLASASYCEACISRVVVDYFASRLPSDDIGLSFIQRKALDRQYHTLFDWDKPNVNKFWSLFGPEFKQYAEARCKEDEQLRSDIEAFMELGRLRNQLVHENYLLFALLKTSREIFELAVRAHRFLDGLPGLLNGFSPPPSA